MMVIITKYRCSFVAATRQMRAVAFCSEIAIKGRIRMGLIYILSIFFSYSCNQQILFDEEKWNESDGIFYTNREKMVNDLLENHLKKGMTYKEVINLLGSSENHDNEVRNTIWYEIMVDYGWDIDHEKGKTLYIEFTNDSIVKDVKLEEWKH
jgi:hypothetical protein